MTDDKYIAALELAKRTLDAHMSVQDGFEDYHYDSDTTRELAQVLIECHEELEEVSRLIKSGLESAPSHDIWIDLQDWLNRSKGPQTGGLG